MSLVSSTNGSIKLKLVCYVLLFWIISLSILFYGKVLAVGGHQMLVLDYGSSKGKVGLSGVSEDFSGFISPGSFYFKDNTFYILDTPNYRVNIYSPKVLKEGSNLGQYVFKNEIILYEKANSSSNKSDVVKREDKGERDSKKNKDDISEEKYIFTDLVVLSDNTILVGSSREGMIYHLSSDGKLIKKIKINANVQSIMRIGVSLDEKLIIVEDPFSGFNYVIDYLGNVIYKVGIEYQPIIIGNDKFLKVSYSDDVKDSNEVKLEFLKLNDSKPFLVKNIKFNLPVHNFTILSANINEKDLRAVDNVLYGYVVLGSCLDEPEAAWFVKVDLVEGKVIKQVLAPVSPEMSCIRYVRFSKPNVFLFSTTSEAGYEILRFEL